MNYVNSKNFAVSKMECYDFNKTKYGAELLIDLVRLETLEKYKINNKPHILSYYDITLITEGNGLFYIDEFHFKTEPGRIFFSSPMQIRKWEFDRMPKGLVLIFEEEFLGTFFNDSDFIQRLSYFNTISQQPILTLNTSDFDHLLSILKNIEKEIIVQKEKDYHILRALLYQVLVWLNRLFLQSNSDDNCVSDKKVIEFRKLVNQHFTDQHTVKFYADNLNITSGHLNDIIKNKLGLSAKEFIQNRVFLEAKRLLLYSTLSVSEIAWKLNFQDDSYFIRAFKDKIGYTPHSYKKVINP